MKAPLYLLYVGRLRVIATDDEVNILDHCWADDWELDDLYVSPLMRPFLENRPAALQIRALPDVFAEEAARLAVIYLDQDPFGFTARLAAFRDERWGALPLLMLKDGRVLQWRPHKKGRLIDEHPPRAEERKALVEAALPERRQ
jgi:hypothetical protein